MSKIILREVEECYETRGLLHPESGFVSSKFHRNYVCRSTFDIKRKFNQFVYAIIWILQYYKRIGFWKKNNQYKTVREIFYLKQILSQK